MKPSFSATMLAAAAATGISVATLLPVLLTCLAVVQPQGMRVASVGEAIFMGAIILIMTPFISICFFFGAISAGPLTYFGAKALRLANDGVAMLTAGLASALAAGLLHEPMTDRGDAVIVLAVGISGAVGGLVFRRTLDAGLKPPPAPPSATPTP
ncbi:hypothetical protein GCM10009422_05880 [Brevundimonas kwangchunensis]|uniref:Uncharacterized protein n=1 Tax=Brevundimonas kwangchunensis TaxID=322163 RepID=A0ABN1GL05_9CAUL